MYMQIKACQEIQYFVCYYSCSRMPKITFHTYINAATLNKHALDHTQDKVNLEKGTGKPLQPL